MKSLNIILIIIIFLTSNCNLFSQDYNFTKQDTLRGSITPERAWWDLVYYHLDISVNPDEKFIKGSNTITYSVLDSEDRLQVDLQDPLKITKVEQNGKILDFESVGNAHFIKLVEKQKKVIFSQ